MKIPHMTSKVKSCLLSNGKKHPTSLMEKKKTTIHLVQNDTIDLEETLRLSGEREKLCLYILTLVGQTAKGGRSNANSVPQ